MSIYDLDTMFNKEMICHYTKEENAKIILKRGDLKFSSLKKCSDPRESKERSFNLINCDFTKHYKDRKDKINRGLNDVIKDTRILCFCGFDCEIDFKDEFIPHYRQDYYRVGFTKSRMWDQYGDDHKGICLLFDKIELEREFYLLNNNVDRKYKGEVSYQYNLESINKSANIDHKSIEECIRNGESYPGLLKHIDKYYKELFLMKLRDYRDECEYRLVVITSSHDETMLSIKTSLKAIILGANFNEEGIDEIKESAKTYGNNIQIHYLSWQNGKPQLLRRN